MNKSPVTIAVFMARHEFLSSSARPLKYDPSKEHPRPVTDDEVRARNEFLKAENARLKAEADERRRGGWYGGNR